VVAHQILVAKLLQVGSDHDGFLDVLLWPPSLTVVASAALVPIVFHLTPLRMLRTSHALLNGSAAYIAVISLALIPLVVFGYYRLLGKERREAMRPIFIVVAGIQVLIFVIVALMERFFAAPFMPTASSLIIGVTVFLSL